MCTGESLGLRRTSRVLNAYMCAHICDVRAEERRVATIDVPCTLFPLLQLAGNGSTQSVPHSHVLLKS